MRKKKDGNYSEKVGNSGWKKVFPNDAVNNALCCRAFPL